MPSLFLEPCVWITKPLRPGVVPMSFWRASGADSVGFLDLRSNFQAGLPGPVAFGRVLSVYPSPRAIPEALSLGADPQRHTTLVERDALQSLLNLPEIPPSATIIDTLRAILGTYADPTGQTRCRPLMPTVGGRLEIHLGGFSRIWAERFDLRSHSHRDKVLAVLQQTYREHRTYNLSHYLPGDPRREHHKRLLGAWMHQYHVADHRVFLPAGVPDEGWLPEDTIILDSFNRANAASLGSSSEGWSWAEAQDGWSIAGNVAEIDQNSANNHARAETDLSSSNHYSQATFVTTGGTDAVRVLARIASADYNNFYAAGSDRSAAPDNWHTHKRVAGTYTSIGTDTSLDAVANDVCRITPDGSSITRRVNGSNQNTATDVSLTDQLRCGISSWSGMTGEQVDAFEAADQAAPGLLTGTITGVGR